MQEPAVTDDPRPRRSVLYLPASNPRAIARARTLDADVVILDLEDAVAPAAKAAARDAAVAAAAEGGWGHRELLIRVNALVTPWSEEDFDAAAAAGFAGIVVPKVADAADIAVAVQRADGVPVWAMIETPGGVLAAERIAATEGVVALVAGTADLAAGMRTAARPDRAPLAHSLSRIVLAARAANILAIDGVFGDLGDEQGLRTEAEQGAAFGFDGKSVIHPNQIGIVNAAFAPSTGEIEAARGLIAAFAAAVSDGSGIATHEGRMVELLHVEAAQRRLAFAQRIAGRA